MKYFRLNIDDYWPEIDSDYYLDAKRQKQIPKRPTHPLAIPEIKRSPEDYIGLDQIDGSIYVSATSKEKQGPHFVNLDFLGSLVISRELGSLIESSTLKIDPDVYRFALTIMEKRLFKTKAKHCIALVPHTRYDIFHIDGSIDDFHLDNLFFDDAWVIDLNKVPKFDLFLPDWYRGWIASEKAYDFFVDQDIPEFMFEEIASRQGF